MDEDSVLVMLNRYVRRKPMEELPLAVFFYLLKGKIH